TQIPTSVSQSGSVLTLTPLLALPPGSTFTVFLSNFASLRDLAGNVLGARTQTFTTAAGTDTTQPQVVAVSPVNQATGVSITNPVTLMLSKPLSAASVGNSSFALYSNGQRLSAGVARSSDGRSVMLSGTWPTGATVQVVATSQAQDLSGNALLPFQS